MFDGDEYRPGTVTRDPSSAVVVVALRNNINKTRPWWCAYLEPASYSEYAQRMACSAAVIIVDKLLLMLL